MRILSDEYKTFGMEPQVSDEAWSAAEKSAADNLNNQAQLLLKCLKKSFKKTSIFTSISNGFRQRKINHKTSCIMYEIKTDNRKFPTLFVRYSRSFRDNSEWTVSVGNIYNVYKYYPNKFKVLTSSPVIFDHSSVDLVRVRTPYLNSDTELQKAFMDATKALDDIVGEWAIMFEDL